MNKTAGILWFVSVSFLVIASGGMGSNEFMWSYFLSWIPASIISVLLEYVNNIRKYDSFYVGFVTILAILLLCGAKGKGVSFALIGSTVFYLSINHYENNKK